jgi:hypothetical protein
VTLDSAHCIQRNGGDNAPLPAPTGSEGFEVLLDVFAAVGSTTNLSTAAVELICEVRGRSREIMPLSVGTRQTVDRALD